MPTLAVLAAAGLVARIAAAAPPAASALAGTGDVQIQGDVTYEPGTGLILVQNGAVLRRGPIVLRARSATYDPVSGEARASGGVLLTDATRAVAADGVRFLFAGPFEAEGVVAFVKDVPVDLSGVATMDEARRAGPSRLSFSGARMQGDARGRFVLEGARLTLCDCGPGCAPSWEVTSRHADVIPGVRATLSWPVLRVTPRFLFIDHPVPVLVLPWLYVPLSDRQTGLLLPEIDSTPATGWAAFEPVFVTLGRSADATVTPGYAFGRKRSDVEAGKAAVRGPGARLELRWAPAEGADGRLLLSWVNDLDAEPAGESGNRFAAIGRHAQLLSERTSLQASLRLFGDPVWVRDLTSDVLGREAPYARSDVLLSHRREALVLEVGANYLEPLRPYGYLKNEATGVYEDPNGFGTLGAGLDVASRWPAASATLLPVGLGPVRVSGRAGFARFAPPSSAWDSGDCWNQPPGTCVEDPRRAAADRADVRAEVSAPLLLGDVASLTPYVRGAGTAYAFEADYPATGEAWAVGGVVLGTEVSRRFGAVRHAVAPRLEWRGGTGSAGEGIAWNAYDLFDRTGTGALSAAPPGPWQQLRAAAETRLTAGGADLLRLEVGQDYDVRLGRLGETFAGAGVAWRRFSASAAARAFAFEARPYPTPPARIPSSFLDRFTELSGSASLADHRGDVVHAGFYSIGAGGSGSLLAGIDPLFDLRPTATEPSASATVGARAVWSGATLGYDVLLYGRAGYVASCSGGGGERRVEAGQPQQHVVTAVWDSPCNCFRIAAVGRLNDCGEPSGSLVLDLSHLGGARASR